MCGVPRGLVQTWGRGQAASGGVHLSSSPQEFSCRFCCGLACQLLVVYMPCRFYPFKNQIFMPLECVIGRKRKKKSCQIIQKIIKCQQAEERKKIIGYFLMVFLLHLIFVDVPSAFRQKKKKKDSEIVLCITLSFAPYDWQVVGRVL